MKKFLSVVLAIVLLLAISSNILILEASNTYDLDELELEVTIPTDYSVITSDTPASDPIFSKLGTTKSALISQFEASNIYLDAISNTYSEEIVVTNMEINISNFSLLSDSVLDTFAVTLLNQYANYGISVSKYEIYHHSQAKFIKVYFTNTDRGAYGLQYYTVYDGKAMNFTMWSYEGRLTLRQESTIKKVVDSIKYDKAPPIQEEGEGTNQFTYTDKDSGVTFVVPANWQQKEFSKDREFIDVKFASTKEDGCGIIYGSTDMWASMSASDKIGYIRSDLNNSAFTESDIAEICGTTADKISVVTYNGIRYFKGEFTASQEAYGIDILLTMTQLVYIENGWMYVFQFSGTSTHKLYSEFESLIKSVQYPTSSTVAGVGSSNSNTTLTDNNNNNSNDSSGVVAVVALLVIVAIILVAVVVSRKKNNEPTNNTPIYNTPTPEPTIKNKPTIYCTKCGQPLPLDSVFCHKCGTKIVKGDNSQ